MAPTAYLQWIKSAEKPRSAVDETRNTYDAAIVRIGVLGRYC